MKWFGRRAPETRRQQFEELLQPILRPLYHTALSYLRDPQDAEDVVQDSIVRAYRAFDEFEPGTNFKAWVFRILTNLCINHHRRRENGPGHVAYEDAEREAEATASARQSATVLPVAALLEQVLDEEVERAVAGLPPEFRTVVILSDVQDFSYQEIASVLGVPIGTVRSRLFRGRRLLREQLATYAVERGILKESEVA